MNFSLCILVKASVYLKQNSLQNGQNAGVQKSYKEIIYVMEPDQPERSNACVQIKPATHTKGVSCRPHPCSKEIQTGKHF